MPTKIVINGRFMARPMTGVERYAHEVYRRLDGDIRLAAAPRMARGLRGHLWEQLTLPRQVHLDEILWNPANTGPLSVARQVVTIHDTAVLEHPEWFRPEFASWYQFLLPRLARRAIFVLTVSDYSRRRLIQTLHLPEEKVISAPPGVDLERFRRVSDDEVQTLKANLNLPHEYILFVGSLDPRKNLPRLISAWQMARERHPNVDLVIVGGRAKQIHPEGVVQTAPGVHYLGYTPDISLPTLYSGALVLAMVSLDEGAGLPALEASACGAPILAARVGTLPEMLGSAALFANPLDIDSIARELIRLLDDPFLRASLSGHGQGIANRWRWEDTAARVQQVLEKAGEL
jgi:glycosyltransferase involved in cell wall biosynthesis